MGIGLALLGVLFYALFQTFTVGANLWLSIWSEDEEAATNIPKRNLYLGVYGALGLLQVCIGVHTFLGPKLILLFESYRPTYSSPFLPFCQII